VVHKFWILVKSALNQFSSNDVAFSFEPFTWQEEKKIMHIKNNMGARTFWGNISFFRWVWVQEYITTERVVTWRNISHYSTHVWSAIQADVPHKIHRSVWTLNDILTWTFLELIIKGEKWAWRKIWTNLAKFQTLSFNFFQTSLKINAALTFC